MPLETSTHSSASITSLSTDLKKLESSYQKAAPPGGSVGQRSASASLTISRSWLTCWVVFSAKKPVPPMFTRSKTSVGTAFQKSGSISTRYSIERRVLANLYGHPTSCPSFTAPIVDQVSQSLGEPSASVVASGQPSRSP